MSLSSDLARQVDAGVRQRGQAYFRRGAVRLGERTDDRVEAIVRGSSLYEVALEAQRDGGDVRIRARCGCPYFEGSGICKHIWATVLEVERRRLMPALQRASAVRLIDGDLAENEEEADDDDIILSLPSLFEEDDGDWDADDDDWDPDDEDDAPDEIARDDVSQRFSRRAVRRREPRRREPRQPTWRDPLETIQRLLASSRLRTGSERHLLEAASESQLLYALKAGDAHERARCILQLFKRLRRRDGTWGEARPLSVRTYRSHLLEDTLDRRISGLLLGAEVNTYGGLYHSIYEDGVHEIVLRPEILDTVLPLLCETGRLYLLGEGLDFDQEPVRLEHGKPWEFRLKVVDDVPRGGWVLSGALERGDERLTGPCVFAPGGWVFRGGVAHKVDGGDVHAWRKLLDPERALHIPEPEADAFLELLFRARDVPPIDWPASLRVEEIRVPPRFHVRLSEDDTARRSRIKLRVQLCYRYGQARILPSEPSTLVLEPKARRVYVRDLEAELGAVTRLRELGCKTPPAYVYRHNDERKRELELAVKRLPEVVRVLVADGWLVEAHGRKVKSPGEFRMNVSSGIDWFDLEAELDFGESVAKLPELLAAVKRGQSWVRLDDGTYGMLPEDWLKKYGVLLQSGQVDEEKVRFRRCQVVLLDALLAEQPDSTWDETFAQARTALRKFDGVRPRKASKGFKGKLRPYQEEGLGWLKFLQQFRFGGCLADDMGLGKTVQALALLESRRLEVGRNGRHGKPSLVVVPRSLIFNWQAEAARFAPLLRVLDHTGPGRPKVAQDFERYHLVLTTYGTLRRDIRLLKDVELDYAIFDEAQAIKNSGSAAAKAVRLLKAGHRLALSGTPIENHLGELWSLFEFLNPGVLGTSTAFKAFIGRQQVENGAARELLARVIRPFLLRRTKSEVAKDLPEKTEQTLFCELDSRERRLYDEIRDHYRSSLLSRVDKRGLKRSKIHVLEALLRLRQAACHPGLIDKERASHSSAKLEALLEQVSEIADGGHKALVFSQFTSLLALVRKKLDGLRISYEYLDGRTRKRAEKIERFQEDPDCSLFLISLKAGGSGLNLTAAEYVFLLDPWWNPAVEAQAIDRTHRIGQTRRVFAYRLIARDTVEEKVVELQERKRDLADAIINQSGSLLRDLTRDDLEVLLS